MTIRSLQQTPQQKRSSADRICLQRQSRSEPLSSSNSSKQSIDPSLLRRILPSEVGLPTGNRRTSEPFVRRARRGNGQPRTLVQGEQPRHGETVQEHKGIDFSSRDGREATPLEFKAGVYGIVEQAGTGDWGTIGIRIANGDLIQYLHTMLSYVKVGDVITPSTVLGVTGRTGPGIDAIHLHIQAHGTARTPGRMDSFINPDEAFAAGQEPLQSISRDIKVQPKLTVNTPGDEFEQEADRVADEVMRISEPQVRHQCACGKTSTGGECSECKNKNKVVENLQKKSTSQVGGTIAPPIVSEVLRSPGAPIPSTTRSFMEARFGQDFSNVRVHTDSQATASAAAVQAKAYTVGHNIIFGRGESPTGDARLLAHELTHVLQQRNSTSTIARKPAAKELKKSRSAPGFNGTPEGTHISLIEVIVNFDGQSTATIAWSNAEKTTAIDPGFAFKTQFKVSPGAGNCNRNCGDPTESALPDSHCTPLGNFKVQGFRPHLGKDNKARQVTDFVLDRGVAFHYYDVPTDPESHGCVRLDETENGADIIHDNSLKGITEIVVSARGNAEKRRVCWMNGKLVAKADYDKMSVRERNLYTYKFASKHHEQFYRFEAMRTLNGLNNADIGRQLKSKNLHDLQKLLEDAVKAPGVGSESNLAEWLRKRIAEKLKQESDTSVGKSDQL